MLLDASMQIYLSAKTYDLIKATMELDGIAPWYRDYLRLKYLDAGLGSVVSLPYCEMCFKQGLMPTDLDPAEKLVAYYGKSRKMRASVSRELWFGVIPGLVERYDLMNRASNKTPRSIVFTEFE